MRYVSSVRRNVLRYSIRTKELTLNVVGNEDTVQVKRMEYALKHVGQTQLRNKVFSGCQNLFKEGKRNVQRAEGSGRTNMQRFDMC